MAGASFPIEGGCTCRAVRYRMEAAPIIVHACHCRWVPARDLQRVRPQRGLPGDPAASPPPEWPAESLQRYRAAKHPG